MVKNYPTRCAEFTGWMFWDKHHRGDAENTDPDGGPTWEAAIHYAPLAAERWRLCQEDEQPLFCEDDPPDVLEDHEVVGHLPHGKVTPRRRRHTVPDLGDRAPAVHEVHDLPGLRRVES